MFIEKKLEKPQDEKHDGAPKRVKDFEKFIHDLPSQNVEIGAKKDENVFAAENLTRDLAEKGHDIHDIKMALRDKPTKIQYGITKMVDDETLKKIFAEQKLILREECKQKTLKQFRDILTYSDDLPEKKLEPDDLGYYRYKCRNKTWAIVSGQIQRLLKEKFITNEDAIEKCQKFVDYSLENSGKTRPTTLSEIEYINEIINLVIGQLEKSEDKKED